MTLYAVRRARGGAWDWSRDLREQDGWDEHARIMDGFAEDNWTANGMLLTVSVEGSTILLRGGLVLA